MLGLFRKGHGLFLENHADTATCAGDIVRGVSHALPENETANAAFSLCLEGFSSIPVTDRKGTQVTGILTSRNLLDYLGGGSLHRMCAARKDILGIPVSKIMEPARIRLDRKRNLNKTLRVFKHTGYDTICLTSKGRIDGVIREGDIVSLLSRPTGVRVWEVMSYKPAAAGVNSPVSDVAGMLVRGGYRRLPVLRDSFLTGVVGSSDILRYLKKSMNIGGLRKDRNRIEDAMNRSVHSVDPDADIIEAVDIMREKDVSMLPVVRDYRSVGIITQRDILEAM